MPPDMRAFPPRACHVLARMPCALSNCCRHCTAACDMDVAALSAPMRLIATLVQDSSQPFAAQFVGAGGLQPRVVSR